MAKKFKKFRSNDRYEDEWGNVNEDRIREKQRGKKRKKSQYENRDRKHMSYKDFRNNDY